MHSDPFLFKTIFDLVDTQNNEHRISILIAMLGILILWNYPELNNRVKK